MLEWRVFKTLRPRVVGQREAQREIQRERGTERDTERERQGEKERRQLVVEKVRLSWALNQLMSRILVYFV